MKKVWWSAAFFAALILAGTSLCAQRTTALPLSVDMNASVSNSDKVMVSWTVLLRLNTDYFEVEKSRDGISWYTMSVVQPDTSLVIPCSYTSIDLFPVKGANFYRIRMKDVTGRISFTPVKTVRVAALCNISVYPNPASNQVNIQLGQVPSGDWSVSLISITGDVMVQKRYSSSNTAISFPVRQIGCGNYIIEINDGKSKQRKRLLINHR